MTSVVILGCYGFYFSTSDCFTSKRDELRLGHHLLYFFTAPFDTSFGLLRVLISSKKLGAGFKVRRSTPEN